MKESPKGGVKTAHANSAKKNSAAKLVSILLAIVLVATMVPALAFATASEEPMNVGNGESLEGEGSSGTDGTVEGNGGDDSGSDLGEGNSNTDGSGVDSGEGDTDGATDPVLSDESSDGLQLNALGVDDSMSTLSDDITPMAASDDISGIAVNNVSPASFQTFDDIAQTPATTPPQLTLTLLVQPTSTYSEGGHIELPLDYNPTAQGLESFTYGTNGSNGYGSASPADFFELDAAALTTETEDASSVVKTSSIRTELDGSKTLVLSLKSKSEYTGDIAGDKTIQLKFSFNDDYKMKIPAGTVMWKPQPTVYVNDDIAATAATTQQVTTSATSMMKATISSGTSDGTYKNGAIALGGSWSAGLYYQQLLDEDYESINYIEVPTGSTLNNTLMEYFNVGPAQDPTLANYNSSGFDRYYRVFKYGKQDFNRWNSGESITNNYQQFTPGAEAQVTPPATIQTAEAGYKFDIRVGMEYKRVNESVQYSTDSFTYTKTDRAEWELSPNTYHGSPGAYGVICATKEGSVSLGTTAAATYSLFNYTNTGPRNTGASSITGVAFELYQDPSVSEKLNFNQFRINASRDISSSSIPAWTTYEYSYVIKNALDGKERSVAGGTFIPQSATAGNEVSEYITPPAPGVNEYIYKIIITPMGSGTSRGELLSLNSFGIANYSSKTWSGQKWPDGTAMPSYSTVDMNWTFYYNDNPNKPEAYPEDNEGVVQASIKGATYIAIYGDCINASATLVSIQAAAGVDAGDTVDFTLQGYAYRRSTIDWKDPRVVVRVPKEMTLSAVGACTDIKTDSSYGVSWKLESTDASYNYYSFVVSGYSVLRKTTAETTPDFSIPVTFTLASNMAPGTYSINRILVSTETKKDFEHLSGVNNALGSGVSAASFGFNTSAGEKYYRTGSSATLLVNSRPKLDVSSAVSSKAVNNLYVNNEIVPAEHGEQVKMMLSITNGGNMDYTGIKLYNILPVSGDALGSSGSIIFKGLSITGGNNPKIYSTSTTGYPTYGLHGSDPVTADLQTADFYTGWDTSGTDTSTKAFFLDFGKQVLAAGETITIELLFDIPDSGDQTAFNQFLYSAKQVSGSTTPLTQPSTKQGFSTETIAIIYHGDDALPALYAEGGPLADEGASALGNMPSSSSASFAPVTPATTQDLSVDSEEPTLTGYEFLGWSETEGAESADSSFAPGSTVTFSAAQTINLYPVWKLNSNTVSYEYTNTVADAPTVPAGDTYEFYDQVDVDDTVSTVPSAEIEGYTFSGWRSVSAGVNVDQGSFNMPANAVVFIGTWILNTNAITYTYTGDLIPEGATDLLPATESSVAYGSPKTVSTSPAVDALEGYTFSGWVPVSGIDEDDITNGNFTMPDAAVAFEGSWTQNSSNVTYVYDATGDTPLNADALPFNGLPQAYTQGSSVNVAANPTEVNGFTFEGWVPTEGLTASDISNGSFTMPTNDVTFTGKWTRNTYSVTYSYTNTISGAPALPAEETAVPFASTVTVSSPAPELTGYTFSGWQSSDVSLGSGSFSMPAKNVSITGTWTPKTYTLTFNKNHSDASGYTEPNPTSISNIAFDAAITTTFPVAAADSGAPTRTGYTFVGWTWTEGGTSVDTTITPSLVWTNDGSRTAYAVWANASDVKFTIEHYKFTTEGVITPAAATDVDYGTTGDLVDALDYEKTYAGYTLDTTHTDTKVTGNILANGTLLLKLFYKANVSTDYAVIHHSVASDGTIGTLDTEEFTGETDTEATATVGSFNGYSYAEDFDDLAGNKEKLTGNIEGNGSLVLHVYYTADLDTDYTVEHYKVVGTAAPVLADTETFEGETDTEAIALTKTYTGYNYVSAYDDGTHKEALKGNIDGDGSLTLRLYYRAIPYTLSYDSNMGAGTVASQTVYYGEKYTTAANGFTRDGYTFANWNTASDYSGATFDASSEYTYAETSNTTLHARWNANNATPYIVEHYHISATGTATRVNVDSYTGTTDTSTPTASARVYASHTFAANDARNITKANIKGDGTTVLKLYYNINYYNVSFVDWNGSVLANRSVPHGGSALAPASPARIGYTFIGWSGAFSNVTGSLSVTAQYRINTYTVTFVDFDGSVISTQSVSYGSSASAPANPTRTGYTFTGWSGNYTNVTSNSTVTATYEIRTFTVTFLGANDTVLSTQTVNYGASATAPADPTRTGYRFAGWDQASSAWTNVTADVTVRATWNDESITTTPITVTPENPDNGTIISNASAEELALAAEEQGIPNIGVPLAAPEGFLAWAMANLILALLCVVLASIFAIVRRSQKSGDKEADSQRRSIGWIIGAAVLALVSVILFVLTQDISQPIVWVDNWTILCTILLIAVVVLGNIGIGRKRESSKGGATPEAA